MDKIICGDCVEEMKKLPNESVHLIITSPPYNVGKEYEGGFDDNKAYQIYLAWLMNVWIESKRVLVDGGRICVNIAPTTMSVEPGGKRVGYIAIHHDIAAQLKQLNLTFRAEIIWYKQNIKRRCAWGSWMSPSAPRVVYSWEYVLVFHKDNLKLAGKKEDADIDRDLFIQCSDAFWQITPETKLSKVHPAPFPIELPRRLIKFYTYKNNVVLDMFGGIGTTAVAAHKTGRQYISIDRSQEYCDYAEGRIAKS